MRKNHIPFVLTGSIRDDGPMPEVIGDAYQGQSAMRDMVRGRNLRDLPGNHAPYDRDGKYDTVIPRDEERNDPTGLSVHGRCR